MSLLPRSTEWAVDQIGLVADQDCAPPRLDGCHLGCVGDVEHAVGRCQLLAGPLKAGGFERVARSPQAGRIEQFHGPTVDGSDCPQGVAGRPRLIEDDASLITEQRIEQAALADVGFSGQHDPPGARQTRSNRMELIEEPLEPLSSLECPILSRSPQQRVDALQFVFQCAAILVEQNGAHPLGLSAG